MYESMAILVIFILIYSSVAGLVERSWVSGPIIFTCFGLLIGADGLDLLLWKLDREVISGLAEVTLALVLFTDAADADMSVLKKTSMLPTRLLLIGLPLTILRYRYLPTAMTGWVISTGRLARRPSYCPWKAR